MSYTDIILLRILIIYIFGALCYTTSVVININFYDEELKRYCKKINIKYTKLYRAFTFSVLAISWPLGVVFDIYFKYFYRGDD